MPFPWFWLAGFEWHLWHMSAIFSGVSASTFLSSCWGISSPGVPSNCTGSQRTGLGVHPLGLHLSLCPFKCLKMSHLSSKILEEYSGGSVNVDQGEEITREVVNTAYPAALPRLQGRQSQEEGHCGGQSKVILLFFLPKPSFRRGALCGLPVCGDRLFLSWRPCECLYFFWHH